ncbi:LAME_0F14642g1_1 [Lachancea meyersii CBS 8951]|uniref:LAME_0F14642g1_1 n=1 Tax=Lachancea meyersii CBS 8951 TaxID=1266667 RepID=A0A1G4JY48_9SACH|nr:LAME_0F14642g1_1 [Lachancea meyersii CBS 8951]
MSRMGYVAPYFMPLVCSSKLWVRIILFFNLLGLFTLAFGLTQLLVSQYDENNMFGPNGQDYFRTSLLGFLSPLALYFLRDFLLGLNPRAILVNLFVDFPFNDWFGLLIIFCLAYPQVQDEAITEKLDDTIWHIIPKQSAIFGISWSLSELLLCLMQNSQRYEELPSPASARRQLENQLLQEEQDLARNNITLSKCIDLKRKSSLISDNVYSHQLQSSISNDAADKSSDTFFVNFNDSSMALLRDAEQGPGPRSSSQERRSLLFPGAVTYFPEIVSKRQFLKELFLINLLVIDSILLIVGHSFIISMYFIYVPGHDRLFAPAVKYFGSRTFGFFTLSVVWPLSTWSFVIGVFLFVWKDAGAEPLNNLHKSNSSPSLHIHTSRPESLQYISSDQLFVMNSIYTQDLMTANEDNEPLILRVLRRLMALWRSLSIHKSFPVIGLTLWSILMFSLGSVATIEQ